MKGWVDGEERHASLQKIRAATMRPPHDSFHFSSPTFFPHNIIITMHARGKEGRVILMLAAAAGVDVGRLLLDQHSLPPPAEARRAGRDVGDEFRLPSEIDGGGERREEWALPC